MIPAALESAAVSDMGRVRRNNEDCYGEFRDGSGATLLVVCDGMGGHQAGERASQAAVEKIGEVFATDTREPAERLRAAFEAANAHVHRLGSSEAGLRGMGTTGVGLLLGGPGQAWVAHVGDSRAYRVRHGTAEQLTVDHSLVARMVAEGSLTPDEALHHPLRNELLRSLGVAPQVTVDVRSVEVAPGDCFVLCSDGLYDVVESADIAAVASRYDPLQAARHLVELANSRGGPDNVTVQIARVPAAPRRRARADEPPTSPMPVRAAPRRGAPPPELVERLSGRGVAALVGAGIAVAGLGWWLLAPRHDAPRSAPSVAPAPPAAAPAARRPQVASAPPPAARPAAPSAAKPKRDEPFPEGWQPPVWIPPADVGGDR